MTKKLRYKFIWITMSIITIMLCIIMSMIFCFTKMNLENDSIHMLKSIAMSPFLQRVPGELSENVHLPYFTLQIGAQGDLIATGHPFRVRPYRYLKRISAPLLPPEHPCQPDPRLCGHFQRTGDFKQFAAKLYYHRPGLFSDFSWNQLSAGRLGGKTC